MAAYIDYAVGHATSEVPALLAGYISNVTPDMMQALNEKYSSCLQHDNAEIFPFTNPYIGYSVKVYIA